MSRSSTLRALLAATCLPLFVGCAAETADMEGGPTSLEDGVDLAWTGTAPTGTHQTLFNTLNRSGCIVSAMKAWSPVSGPVPREQYVSMFLKVDQDPMSIVPCAAGRVPAYQLVTNGLFSASPAGSNTGRVIAAPGANVVYVSNLVTSWWGGPPNPVSGKLVRASMRSLATGAAVGSIADIRCTNGVVSISSQTLDLATGTLTLVGSKNCLTVGLGEVPSANPMWRATYVGFGLNPTMNAIPTTFQTF
jgi:hypothetical protein